MKKMVQLLLFVFISFLITPTINNVYEGNSDMTLFYRYSNQEKANIEIVAVFSFDVQYAIGEFSFSNLNLIQSENLSKHDIIGSKIIIHPPKHI